MPLPKQHTYTSEDYWNLPDGERAELIDGQLYNMAPPSRIHQRLVSQFTRVIGQYIADHHSSCQVYPAPFAVNLDADDEDWVEPDISVICDHSKLTDKGCSGAPDWIVEIVSPSSRRDGLLHQKHDLFRCRRPGILDRRSCEATYHRVSLRRRCSSDDLSVRSTGCRWNLR